MPAKNRVSIICHLHPKHDSEIINRVKMEVDPNPALSRGAVLRAALYYYFQMDINTRTVSDDHHRRHRDDLDALRAEVNTLRAALAAVPKAIQAQPAVSRDDLDAMRAELATLKQENATLRKENALRLEETQWLYHVVNGQPVAAGATTTTQTAMTSSAGAAQRQAPQVLRLDDDFLNDADDDFLNDAAKAIDSDDW